MSGQKIQAELSRYLTMADSERWNWLAKLLFALTQFARGTYATEGPGLEQPHAMRMYNELLHRVASQIRNKAISHYGMPDEVFIKAIAETIPLLGINADALADVLG